jgi:hypothetical protein
MLMGENADRGHVGQGLTGADVDVIEFLHTVAGGCVQLLDVDAAGLMPAEHLGQLHAGAASTASARLLELFELQASPHSSSRRSTAG